MNTFLGPGLRIPTEKNMVVIHSIEIYIYIYMGKF